MSQTKETGRAARQGPPPRGQPISFRGRRAPSKHSPTSPQLSPLFSGISAQSASMIPNPPVPKIRSSRPPAPQSGPLGTSPREAPSSRRPALGALRKGRVGSGPASPSVPGRRHLDPAGARSPRPILGCLFRPLGTVPAGTEQLGGDGAAAAAGDRRRVRALSEARAGPRPARRARQHRARTRVPGRRRPPEGVRPEREGMGSWSALEAPSTNARSGPGSAQTAAPGAATGAER